jgi:hypothetical protein
MSTVAAPQIGCSRCASPLEDGDLRCAVCALPVAVARLPVERARVNVLRCTWCGAAIAFDANHQAPACGFCGSVMKVEQPIDPVEAATLRVPFVIERERAESALRAWLGKRGYFAPKTLRDEAVLDSLTPLCWAAWIVSAEALVAWTADSDAGADRSAWAPHAGRTQLSFGNIAVTASRGLRHDECAQLVPYYDLSQAVGVNEPTIPGEMPAMIESFDAQRSAAREHVHRAIESLARQRVKERDVPGHRFRNVHVSCLLERQTTSRVALPAWVLAYRYRGSAYRAIVHGQHPDIVIGTSPIDWGKVARLAGVVVLAVLTILAAIVLLR